jgi:hypothetical protein
MTRSLSENTWEVWLDPEDLDDGPHEVLVRAKDRSGHTMTKNVTFFMDTMSPTVAPVYVPSKTKSISGDFKFAFAADDPSGIARGELVIGDNKSRWVIPRNPATGLYEFSLDTTQFPDGDTKKYCAVFTDKAGRQESYCSSFKVDNSGVVLPPDQPQKITIIKESEIWPWILVAILAIITFVAAVFVVRERYLRKADMKEMELMRRSRNDEEEEGEGPPSTPLPDDGPVMTGRDDMGKKGDVDGEADGPAKGVRVKVESGKKAKVRVGTYELSALAPEAVGTGAGVAPDVSEGAGQDEAEVKEEGRRRKGPKRFVKCPMCTSKIAVKSDERPLVLSCPTCGAKGRLK